MENKKMLSYFSETQDDKNNDSKDTQSESENSSVVSKTDDELDKYRQENYEPSPSVKREDKARIKKRKKIAIISAITIVGLGLVGLWMGISFWNPPVLKVKSIKDNKLCFTNGIEYDFTKNVNLQAQWYQTSNQIIYTINPGLFSGISFMAWRESINVYITTETDVVKIDITNSNSWSQAPMEIIEQKATPVGKDFGKSLSNATMGASVMTSGPNPFFVILQLLPTLLIIIMIFYFFKMLRAQSGSAGGDSIFGIGKSQAKLAQSNVRFTDVAGIEEEKNELMEIVDYLKNPGKYAAMGARAPKGVILYGPPGTGKTLLAKAVAGEAGVPFYEVAGSSFEDMLVGVGAKRVRNLFSEAAKAAPAIIFIDEIDSVASKRGQKEIAGASGGIADQTINQLLAEMDGFSTNAGVVVMAATNRLDVLDPAILRPGRFDRHIQVNLPDIKERLEILKIHSRNKNISSSVNLEDIARRTPGFSGAQLENVLNEATLLAVRENKNTITMKNLDEAIDRVIAGPAKTTKVITLEEKKQIAYHEAGHALVGLHNPGSDVVQKITIIPRGNAAGYTISTPEKQEMSIQRKCDLLAIISTTLGGRAAEETIYGKDKISTGAANDLYKVTNMVRAMVMQLGMSSLGMTQFVPSEGTVNPYASKLYSDETAKLIDKEVDKIISEQYKRALNIIVKNKKELDLIVESLLLLETITKEQIDYIHKNIKLPKEALDKKNDLAKDSKSKNKN